MSRTVGRLRDIIVLGGPVCFLCPETRCLEQAHLMPVAMYKDARLPSRRTNYPDYMRYVIMLCPTHHKCYDKFRLNATELATMRHLTLQLHPHFVDLLEHLHPTNAHIDIHREANAVKIDEIWRWWRNYLCLA